jgi:hypothetical protein
MTTDQFYARQRAAMKLADEAVWRIPTAGEDDLSAVTMGDYDMRVTRDSLGELVGTDEVGLLVQALAMRAFELLEEET